MPGYEHNKLHERISHLNQLPESVSEYADWIRAEEHLAFLKDNAQSEMSLVVYAVGEYILIHTVIVNETSLSDLDKDELLKWKLCPRFLLRKLRQRI